MKQSIELINFSPENLKKMKESGLECDITSKIKTVTFDKTSPEDIVKFVTALQGIKKLTFHYSKVIKE